MQVANMAAHLLSCTDDRQDQALQLNLESVYSFSLAGGQLRLLAKDGHVLFLQKKRLTMKVASSAGSG
ncbi:hypothetical protein KRR40_07510 [Niabella defluvii]|nr:hypothetical protein KRR40_07510 [Niabella sp. I65]